MLIDFRWEIWDNQSLTVAEESRTNGALKDLEEGGVTDESISDQLWLNVMVGTAFTSLTEGVNIAVITSDSATFASGVKCLGSLGCKTYPILVTELTAGAKFSLAFPRYALHKYLELYWEPITTAGATGKIDAWFALRPIAPCKVQKFPAGYV